MSEVHEPIGPMELSNETIEKIVTGGDLAGLNVEQRAQYYQAVCKSLGLNHLSKPFEYLTLNGKLRLYALRDCADQLRRLHGISICISNRERVSDLYVVTARAKDRSGREDESTGAVTVGDLKGDALANALMKAETKAKRRVTLSIAGLGWLDEVEIDTIQGTSAMTARGRSVGESLKPDHPTRDQVASLIELARSCDVDLLGFGQHMRRLMELSQETKVTKKFLSESMTQGQFEEAWQHYNMRLRQLVEEEVMAELGRDGETPTPDTSGTPESMGDERTDHASLDTRESSTVDEPTSTNSTEPASAEDASASRLAPFSAEEVIYASKVTVDTVVDLAPAVGEDAVKKVQHLMAQHGGRLPQKDAEELTTEFRQRQAVKAKAAKKG